MIYTDPIIANSNIMSDAPVATPSSQVDKTTFLKLLVMQLSFQDPLDPMSSENFMGQVAQFNELEQSMNLNDSFNDFLSFQALTQASSMIGKEVQAVYSDDTNTGIVEGKVEEVILLNNIPILKLSSGYEVPIQAVFRVGENLE